MSIHTMKVALTFIGYTEALITQNELVLKGDEKTQSNTRIHAISSVNEQSSIGMTLWLTAFILVPSFT